MSIVEDLRSAKRRANRLGALRHYAPRPLDMSSRYARDVTPADAPTLALVTPSLNHGPYIAQALRSVLDQNYPALEYVVQDGGSDDGSREIIEAHADRLHSWEASPDDGQADALNRGFARTSGELMAYLNADDILLPGSLAFVADFMSRNPQVDVVYGHRILIDSSGMEIGRHVVPRHDDSVLTWADFVPQETMFWRRSAWVRAGGEFDVSFQCAIDWDLLVRLRDTGAKMVRLPRFLGAFRVHGDQKTILLGSTVAVAEMERIRERTVGRPVAQDEVLRRVRPYLVRHVLLDQLHRLGILRY